MVGVGIDIVDLDEFDDLLTVSDGALLETAWTPAEVRQCAGQSVLLAACWAAKEAAMKAIGLGLGDIDPLEMEVDMEKQQRSSIRVSGQLKTALDRKGVSNVTVTIAHDRQWAIAAAVALGDDR